MLHVNLVGAHLRIFGTAPEIKIVFFLFRGCLTYLRQSQISRSTFLNLRVATPPPPLMFKDGPNLSKKKQ